MNLSLEGAVHCLGAHEPRHRHPPIMALTPPPPSLRHSPAAPTNSTKNYSRRIHTFHTPASLRYLPMTGAHMAFNQLHPVILIRRHTRSPSFCSIKQISQAPTRRVLSFFVTVAYALDRTGRHRSMRFPSPLARPHLSCFYFSSLTRMVFVL